MRAAFVCAPRGRPMKYSGPLSYQRFKPLGMSRFYPAHPLLRSRKNKGRLLQKEWGTPS